MPSIFPKTFARRKSSANALDDFDKPTESTFRVIPRAESSKPEDPQRPNPSRPLSSPIQHDRQQSFEDEAGPWNRGSNGSSTANSGLSRFYDTTSSARLSSSSTLPSAVEAEDDLFTKKIPTVSEGRTSSFTSLTSRFGLKKTPKASTSPSKLEVVTDENQNPNNARALARERAMTASSYASTAQPLPPKLEDLPSSDFGGGLGDIFSSIGQRRSAYMGDAPLLPPPPPPPGAMRSESEPTFPPPAAHSASARPSVPPTPIEVATPKERGSGGSPYSWSSRRSNDALMNKSPEDVLSPVNLRGPPVPPHRQTGVQPPFDNVTTSEQKSGMTSNPRTNAQRRVEDADARKVRESFRASRDARDMKPRQAKEQQKTFPEAASSDISLKTQSASSAGSSVQYDQIQEASRRAAPSSVVADDLTPRAKSTVQDDEEEPLFGHKTSAAATSNVHWAAQKQPQRMTQAEFAHARHQQDRDSSQEESEEEEEYMDEDAEEEERKKLEEVRLMRLQQSAKMSNWRETMKKTTGGVGNQFGNQPRPSSMDRPKFRSSASSSEMLLHKSMDEEGDDDTDDIPLGILSAHGFPKMQRLSHASSLGNIRPSSTPGVRTSTMGSNVGGAHGPLPAFARGLPADVPSYPEPYYGANLQAQASREPLGYGNLSGPGSAYGGSNAGTEQPTLVNMIADREKADQARRGGSTKIMNNFYGQPTHGQRIPDFIEQQQRREAPMGFPHHMPMPNRMTYQAPPMAPPQFAGMGPEQMQLLQGISMLMAQNQQQFAMQQAMMQQQQPMMAAPQQQQMMPPHMGQPMMQPQMGSQANLMGMPRPMSMASSAPGMGQRSRSMVNPTRQSMLGIPQQQQGLQPGYTPSIAPSERNNVGTSARYRSVQLPNDGSSTVASSSTLQPPAASAAGGQRQSQKIAVRVKPKQAGASHARADDQEDEEGWGASRAKATSKWGGNKTAREDLKEMIPSFD